MIADLVEGTDHRRAATTYGIPALVAVVTAVAVLAFPDNDADLAPLAWVVTVVAAGSICLLWREQYPIASLAAATTVAVLAAGTNIGPEPALSPLVALYSVGLRSSRCARVVAGLALTTIVLTAGAVFNGEALVDVDAVAEIALVLLPLVLAARVRAQRAYVGELLARLALADEQREEHARQLLERERLRVARELHDVLTHTLSTINVQAGVAVHLIGRNPGQAGPALLVIRDASREALRELRGMLGLLRSTSVEPATTAPAPGIADVAQLVENRRSAGLPVSLERLPTMGPVPAAVQLAAYRLVQESLTNVARHAGPVATWVSVNVEGDDLVVCVTNAPGQAREPDPGTGSGLLGMKERVLALGGRLTAGPQQSGDFRVLARVPLTPAAPHGRT